MKIEEIVETKKFPNFITATTADSLNKKLKKRRKDFYGFPVIVPGFFSGNGESEGGDGGSSSGE